jgi:6-phosphogluconolactonase
MTNLLVGTYPKSGGEGLVAAELTGDHLTHCAHHGAIANASFAVWGPSGVLYAVAEQPNGLARAAAAGQGQFVARSEAHTGGDAPCHLALDPSGSLLAAANYESGSIALFRLDASGDLPLSPTWHHQLEGSGPNPERQMGPHAHWVGFTEGGRRLYCVDLGSDAIVMFDMDPDRPSLDRPKIAYRAPAGSGPRHLAFHPTLRLAFLVSELASTLTMLSIAADGTLEALQTVSTLPPDAGESLGGAIAINDAGNRIYVTNRGHDSIAVFAFDGTDMSLLQHVPSGGASPRFLLLIEQEQRMLLANEESSNVALFAIENDGRLMPLGIPTSIPGAAFLTVDHGSDMAPDQM